MSIKQHEYVVTNANVDMVKGANLKNPNAVALIVRGRITCDGKVQAQKLKRLTVADASHLDGSEYGTNRIVRFTLTTERNGRKAKPGATADALTAFLSQLTGANS
jgi:hypothetical protein